MIIDPDELVKLASEMESPLERYLKFKQVVDRYDRGKKAKLSELMMVCDGTIANREMIAQASEQWKAYLAEWDSAEKEAVKARVKYETLANKFNALQSYMSYQREHMKRFGS